MRLSATKALLSRRTRSSSPRCRRSTASAIRTITFRWCCTSSRGEHIDQRELIRRLTELQYTRNDIELRRGTYRVRGEVIDVFPAESEIEALRIELFDGEIENLSLFDPLTGEVDPQDAALHDLPEDRTT